MAKTTKQKRRFNTKNHLLALFLSIGITGICMLVFSAWTPFYVRADSTSTDNTLQSGVSSDVTDKNSGDNGSADSGNISDITDATGDVTTVPGQLSPTAVLTPTLTPTPTPTSTPTPTPNPLQLNAYPEVNELIEAYFDAKLSPDDVDFDSLVSDPSLIDMDYLQLQYGLVTEFSNINCYTKNGIAEVAYIVYVSYDSKIVTIDTPVPALDRLTLVYAEDGSNRLLINNKKTLSDEVVAYCNELFTHDDVQQMYTQEAARFENAIASDPELSQLYNRLEPEGAD